MRTRMLAISFVTIAVLMPAMTAQDPKGPFKKPDGKANPFRKAPEAKAAAVKEFNDKPTQEQVAFFEKKIRPVLIDNCYACHDSNKPDKIKGGLALDTREGARIGGDSGAVILAGDASRSPLIKAIRYTDEKTQMPPKKKLSDEVIADFEKWVAMGAPDPRDGGASKHTVKSEIDIEKGKQFWAYQMPKAAPAPAVKQKDWPKCDSDKHLLAAMEAKNLKPVADADSRALVRRVHLDLIGIPPTSEVAEKFVFDYDRDPAKTLETTIDTLLASKQFGERWGRHWLDVARYAESTGKTVNFNYPHAWRYRDYVIDSYNRDTPFDLFVKEQLAGDLLPAKTDADKARLAIATGFLQIGSKNLNERNRVQYELDVADEQIDTVTQAFLGTTAACARCHDHKFDPIPTKDYYALVGIFRSTENCYGTVRFVQANQPSSLISLPQGSVPTVIEPLTQLQRGSLEKQIADARESIRQQTDPIRNIFTFATIAINESKLSQYEKDGTPKVLAMGSRDKYIGRDSPVYARGEPDKAGETVPRGVLQVVGGPKVTFDRKTSGRLQLAEWIASDQNPLTARVYVNRVWLHLFGRGIVASPDNFGTTGIAPSNLALLDSLAMDFTKNGWSTKKLIKSIMLSHAYQLSTKFDVNNFNADPENDFVWRMSPQRLDAEAVRDSILAVSGQLTTTPPAGSAMAKAGDGPTSRPGLGSTVRVDPNATYRSVYMTIVRDNLPESMSLFDMADPSMVVGDRDRTSVPAQSLFLMNNPFVITNSEKAAEKIMASSSSDSQRLRTAYLTFFGRVPTEKELATAEKFLKEYPTTSRRQAAKEPWVVLCQAMFGSAEFLMRN